MKTEPGTTSSGTRATATVALKTLKTPQEGGTKKQYQDFLDKIDTHVSINWDFGKDISHVLKHNEKPTIEEPEDLTSAEESVKWKVRLWNQKVDRYGMQMATMDDNSTALYSLIIDNSSKLMNEKIKSKQGYAAANTANNAIWLLKIIEDIIVNFEETKPKLLALDDQMELIMKFTQGSLSNEDFIKTFVRELKIYEKHGGDFLWGTTQIWAYNLRTTAAVREFKAQNNGTIDPSDEAEINVLVKKALKEEILAMAIIKRANPAKYGPLQKNLRNSYLLGNNAYPTNVADVLKVLNNYTPEYKPGTVPSDDSQSNSTTNY